MTTTIRVSDSVSAVGRIWSVCSNKVRRKSFLLTCAVILLALSYFYQVPQNPPGFYIDESSISYNAYTISRSGEDEYGQRWPLFFRAFGEYKNPIYIYLLATLFRVFGPSILVARLLSASLGVAATCLLWLLTFRISRRISVACLIALSACLTPWLFENSRLVFEVALYPALLILFLLAVHRASQKEQWRTFETISVATTLALLTYSYSVGRLLAPLLALGLLIFTSRKRLPGLIATWAIYITSLLPAIVFNSRNSGALMFRFWLLSYIAPQKSVMEMAMNFCRHYISNLNPWTIAVTGEMNVRDHVGNMGSILAPTLLLGVAGIFYVIRFLRNDDWWRFMLFALVVSPIPASLTTTDFPQLRLIALPVLLHVFMTPAVLWLTQRRSEASARLRSGQIVVALLVLLMIAQGVIYRIQFREAGPPRWYIFDEQFPREVLPTALAPNRFPIYFHDPPGKSGYVQAYWYGMLRGLPADHFVRLPSEGRPPHGAVVISTAEQCSDCQLLLKSINYIVYISGG